MGSGEVDVYSSPDHGRSREIALFRSAPKTASYRARKSFRPTSVVCVQSRPVSILGRGESGCGLGSSVSSAVRALRDRFSFAIVHFGLSWLKKPTSPISVRSGRNSTHIYSGVSGVTSRR